MIRAKLTLSNGKSTPSTTAIQFLAEGATLSGIEFELVGSGYRISLSKKRFGAGTIVYSVLCIFWWLNKLRRCYPFQNILIWRAVNIWTFDESQWGCTPCQRGNCCTAPLFWNCSNNISHVKEIFDLWTRTVPHCGELLGMHASVNSETCPYMQMFTDTASTWIFPINLQCHTEIPALVLDYPTLVFA